MAGLKNDFNREFIFSLIQYCREPNKCIFGGIFKVVRRYDDWLNTEIGYELELENNNLELISSLVVDFYRYQGMRGRSFKLENYYEEFDVPEILMTG